MVVIAVYPGTFDPLTRGHEDLVRRAAGLFAKLVVGVADSRSKQPFFVLDERIAIAREVLVSLSERRGRRFPRPAEGFRARAERARHRARPARGVAISSTSSRWPG